ncbi:triacylglycerol lipase [Actinopolyspora mzabensis]|uniref:Triacylglycerol lipase n=1 Tax=Actinopolyspora mzabensis TaxID=995066 RepID=A0A1G9CP50_ACTMZ|nr:triacylglycerol lipase [Actinopolyspora mzabensis]SDK53432.1 triacylglycerol lipase [Actinopolyspora mzabensis]
MRRILGVLLATAAMAAFGSFGVANAAGPNPVVFVHGYTGSASNWTTAEAQFRLSGYSSSELHAFEYDWTQSNKQSAAELASYVDNVLAETGANKVDIVNHSMGGLVTRWYMKELGGHTDVANWASLAGANQGTTSASACLIYASCREMSPGSDFEERLNSGDWTPGDSDYATWYSPTDGVIIPYTNTRVLGADNNHVVGQTHLGFLTDISVLGEVIDFFEE